MKGKAMTHESRIAITLATIAVAFGLAGLTCGMVTGCKPGWNDPHPIVPEPGLPCGRLYYSCHDVCCYHTDICRPGGYCAFGGLEPPTWGAGPDAGKTAEPGLYRGLTPEQARKAGPR
jgi:hypothetical protein